jgi:adenylate kinase family enzyme
MVRVHLFGASGSGTTTLGRALAQVRCVRYLDSDDYYWLPADPPYTLKRPPAERVRLIEQDVADVPVWVLSGSLCSWGDPLLPRFTLAVFLYLDPGRRLTRLAARERQRYGTRIEPGGDLHEKHQAFMSWAEAYDTARAPLRSLDLHERWMRRLPCPVLRLDSARPVSELVAAVQAGIEGGSV